MGQKTIGPQKTESTTESQKVRVNNNPWLDLTHPWRIIKKT